jgi:hypothetical protein
MIRGADTGRQTWTGGRVVILGRRINGLVLVHADRCAGMWWFGLEGHIMSSSDFTAIIRSL